MGNEIGGTLKYYGSPMGKIGRKMIGREKVFDALSASMKRFEQFSTILLAEPGAGKTALAEEWAARHKDEYLVYNVDITAMGDEGPNRFASRIHALVDDVIALDKQSKLPIVLFIDEVHMLGMHGYMTGLEALKPAMASGVIRLIGATTDEEYVKYIEGNSAFDRRFQRLDVPITTDDVVLHILESMHQRYLPDVPVENGLFQTIIEYGKFIPKQSQPLKSIDLLDAMFGWHRSAGLALDRKLLNQVIRQKTGANPDWQANIPKLITYLKARVLDQDMAIETLEGSLYAAVEHMNDGSRPMGNFLFAGPTGSGKTELVKALTLSLFGKESAMIRFDMSEYNTETSVDRFRETLADAIAKQPFSVVLFDEIEKAAEGIKMILLQITDDGRLTNRFGKQVTFLDAYIVMTSNAGAEVMKSVQQNGLSIKDFQVLLRRQLGDKFPPEFLGRLDAIVPFQPLGETTYKKLAELRLRQLARKLAKRGILLKLGQQMITYLTGEHFSLDTDAGGGRALQARIKDEVIIPIAKVMNWYPTVKEIKLNVYGNMSQQNKQDTTGTAFIGVQYYVLANDERAEGRLGDLVQAIDANAIHYDGQGNMISQISEEALAE